VLDGTAPPAPNNPPLVTRRPTTPPVIRAAGDPAAGDPPAPGLRGSARGRDVLRRPLALLVSRRP
jgi:hypothetical protein